MIAIFVGAFQLFVMINACVRSMAGKWLLGSLGALVRIFLLLAVSMAKTRIRIGAEPSTGFYVALVFGPTLSLVLWLLAIRRKRALATDSEAQIAAGRVATSWLAVTVIDAVLVVMGLSS